MSKSDGNSLDKLTQVSQEMGQYDESIYTDFHKVSDELEEAKSQRDAFRKALEEINEYKFSMAVEKYNAVFDIATKALEEK